MAPAETISVKKEAHFSKGPQTVWKSVTPRPKMGSKSPKGKGTYTIAIQGPRKVLIKKRGIVKCSSIMVSLESVEVPCKFENAVIAECQEAGMTADEIQKWIQEL